MGQEDIVGISSEIADRDHLVLLHLLQLLHGCVSGVLPGFEVVSGNKNRIFKEFKPLGAFGRVIS
jgi:hypothetical protein